MNKDCYDRIEEAFASFQFFCYTHKMSSRHYCRCAGCPCLRSKQSCFATWLFLPKGGEA